MVSIKKWILFLGPKIRIWARKSVFCCRTPDFVIVLFVALGETVDFAHSDLLCNFSLPRNARFREKRKRLTRQKVFPNPTVSAINSPSALSAQALWAKRAGWIQESLSQDSMTVTTIIKQTTYSPPRILVMTSSEGSPKVEWPSTSEAESAV